jgi:class 3 adenylate cyclase/tetratricopeptide (TPR) repeat protein
MVSATDRGSIMDVGDWLRNLGLGQYETLFRQNDIDAEVLSELTEGDLEKFGVSFGHRKRLLKAIASLDSTETAVKPAAVPALAQAERRQLTVMFCDLVGSTALSGRLDPEDLREVIGAYHRCSAEWIERHGGFVAKYIGDGVLAYFGYPQAHEHDAEQAVRAGLALVEAAPKLETVAGVPLQVRVGIATGPVIVGDLIGAGAAQEQAVVGETPNLAARLQALAEPGAVVIASSTKRLIGGLFEYRDLGAVTLKGFAADVKAWQVLGVGAAESRFEALHVVTTPLVGRDEEIELLLRRWEQAKRGEGCVVLLSGEPGIGKSRIIQALLERLSGEPHTRLRYFCSPHHQNSALYPSLTQLERAAGLRREDSAEQRLDKLEATLALGANDIAEAASLLAELLSIPTGDRYPPIGLSPQKKKEKILLAQLAQVEGLAARQPLLTMYEDAHWSDPTTRESLDLLVDRAPSMRVLAVITFRPEFVPLWIGRPHVSQIALSRLPPRRRTEMIANLIGGRTLPKEIADHIVERTDGVPLFIEELTKTVIESGILTETDHGWVATGPMAPLAIPTTLHASLLARLDRLAPTREVAQIAAALGRQFSHELISAATPMPQRLLDEALAQLVNAELIFRRGDPPDAEYTFKHALVQDAAYSTLLRSQRQLIQGRIVAGLEKKFPEVAASQPERLARHCAEAGQIDKAVGYLIAASQQALARSAMAETESQTREGLDLIARLPDGAARQQRELELQLVRGQALLTTRGLHAPEVGEALGRARELCEHLGRPPQLAPVIYGLWQHHLMRNEPDITDLLAREMWGLQQRGQNDTLIASACYMSGINDFFREDYIRARGYFEDGLRRLGAVMGVEHSRSGSLIWLAGTLLRLGYLDQARARYEESLAEARKSNPFSLAVGLVGALDYKYLSGDLVALASLTDQLLALSDEQGFGFWGNAAKLYLGWRKAMERRQDEGIAEIAAAITSSGHAIGSLLLAEAYGMAGRPREGLEHLADAGKELNVYGDAHSLRVRARLQLSLGDSVAAEDSLRQAIATARRQQAKFLELLAATDLARLWSAQGKRAEARDLLAPVHGWFTEGLDTPFLREAKALLDDLGGSPAVLPSQAMPDSL